MSIDNTFGGVTSYTGSDRDGLVTEEPRLALSSNQSAAAADGDAPSELEPPAEFQNKSYELAFLGGQLRERVLSSASTRGASGSQGNVAFTVKLPEDPSKRYDSREVRNKILREQFGFSDEQIAEYDLYTDGKGFVVFNERNPKNKGADKIWATPREVKSWENRKTGEVSVNVPESKVAELRGFPAKLDALRKEAGDLIAGHFVEMLAPFGRESFGRELAGTLAQRPELVREVFNQLDGQTRAEVGRSMAGSLTDQQLVALARTAGGKDLLQKIGKSLEGDAALGSFQLFGQGRQEVRQRIVTALAAAAVPERPRGGARYTAADLKILYGRDVYGDIDDWVNNIARGEGGFATSGDVGDGAGLSVGIMQWTQSSGRLGELMRKYKEVAERDGKLEEFYQVFGGNEQAEDLLAKLDGSNPSSVKLATIKPLFAEAGRRDVFKKAQVEAAREAARGYINLVAPYLPYSAADGQVSGRMLAAGLVVKNIGGARDDPSFVRRAMGRATAELYDEVAAKNPDFNRQLQERLAAAREQNKELKPKELQAVLDRETAQFKREVVERNVSEQRFLDRVVDVGPRILYTTPWKYTKYHAGVENRIREAINSVDANKRVNPRGL